MGVDILGQHNIMGGTLSIRRAELTQSLYFTQARIYLQTSCPQSSCAEACQLSQHSAFVGFMIGLC